MPRWNGEPTKRELRLKRQQERFVANMAKLTPEQLAKVKIVDGEVRVPSPRKPSLPHPDPEFVRAEELIEQGKLVEAGTITPNEKLREEMITLARQLAEKNPALSADVYRSAIKTGMSIKAAEQKPEPERGPYGYPVGSELETWAKAQDI